MLLILSNHKSRAYKVFKHEFLTDRAVSSGIKRGSIIINEGVLEVKCTMYGDFWPRTPEFFYRDSKVNNTLKSRCIDCFTQTKHWSQIPKTNIIGRPRKV